MGSNVIRQTNISPIQFTNFLSHGAILRKADSWLVYELSNEPTEESKNPDVSIACMDFYGREMHALKCRNVFQLSTGQLQSLLQASLEVGVLGPSGWEMTRDWQSPKLAEFEAGFREIQKRIANQHITKAVPSCFYTSNKGPANRFERAQLLLQLVKAPANLWPYGHWSESQGVIGATPEILFERSEGTLKTMALAGTRRKGEGELQDFLNDPKEVAEHNFVVRDLVKELSELGEVQLSPMQVLELPSLWHLQTKIEVKLQKTISDLEIAQKLNPTPALGVAPRSAGYHWMQELPGQVRRHEFGAPILFSLSKQEAICLVSIRNVQWDEQGLIVGSGCGVVKESVLEKEWRELFLKRESVLKLFGLKEESL